MVLGTEPAKAVEANGRESQTDFRCPEAPRILTETKYREIETINRGCIRPGSMAAAVQRSVVGCCNIVCRMNSFQIYSISTLTEPSAPVKANGGRND